MTVTVTEYFISAYPNLQGFFQSCAKWCESAIFAQKLNWNCAQIQDLRLYGKETTLYSVIGWQSLCCRTLSRTQWQWQRGGLVPSCRHGVCVPLHAENTPWPWPWPWVTKSFVCCNECLVLGHVISALGNVTSVPGNVTSVPGSVTSALGNVTSVLGNVTY